MNSGSMASTAALGIVWFRQDLRLADNPALRAACRECASIIPLFIDDPTPHSVSALGGASRVWLHHALEQLAGSLEQAGARLLLARGEPHSVLHALIEQSGAERVYWNRCYDPVSVTRDTAIKQALTELQPRTFNASLLREPWQVLKKDGDPYRVFTPYWRAVAASIDADPNAIRPVPAIRRINGWSGTHDLVRAASSELSPTSVRGAKRSKQAATLRYTASVADLELLPTRDWSTAMMAHWQVGERASLRRLKRFLGTGASDYDEQRDRPDQDGTSRLSPHLHFGEIGPRQILHALLDGRSLGELDGGELVFAKEVVWREFAHNLLFHFPELPETPLDRRFLRFPWHPDAEARLERWTRGTTGIPIVDAGMRQLYATGWMHNRVRMIVGSFLVKNLGVPWQRGEAWFEDTLVDADRASNSMGWQWIAGCGADAAPFFRVFNPVLQGEKFDPDGAYVKHWVPELATLAARDVHKPWTLHEKQRRELDYPQPLVDLKASRQAALDAFSTIKR